MWQRNHVPMCDSDLYTMEEPEPQARLSPRTEQQEQELEKRRKRRRRSNNNNNNNNNNHEDDDDDDNGKTNQWRANEGTKTS